MDESHETLRQVACDDTYRRTSVRIMSRDNDVTTTVSFDRATYKRLRLLAVELDTNVREMVREAVADYLTKQRKGGRKR